MKKTKKLWTENILKLIIKLSLPSMIWMFINSLYNIIDSIYIWHYSSKWLIALSLAFPIQLFLISIATWLGIASASVISRLAWKQEKDKIQRTMNFVTFIWILYGILTFIIWAFFIKYIVEFFVKDPELISMTSWYLSIIMMWNIFMVIPIIFNNFLRAHGDSLTPMKVMILWAISNIALDPLFIFWLFFFPELWVKWAALATIIARLISTIYVIYVIYKQKYKIKIDYSIPEKQIIKELLIVWIPSTLMIMLWSIAIVWVNKIIWNYSYLALAVFWIYARLEMFILMPIMWLSQWIQPIIGYNYWSKQYKRIRQTIIYSIIISLIISTFAFGMFQLSSDMFIRVFTKDPQIINMWVYALKIISISFPFIWINMIISKVFQSFWNWIPSLIMSFLRQIIILLPLMYILWKYYWLNGIRASIPISEWIVLFIFIIWIYVFLKNKKAL